MKTAIAIILLLAAALAGCAAPRTYYDQSFTGGGSAGYNYSEKQDKGY